MIPILMYHSIAKMPSSEVMRSLHVHPAAFERQMRLLKWLGYRVTGITEALNLRDSGHDKIVALTFDDAYQNFYTHALPVLNQFGFSATVYVVSDLIGQYNRWDELTGISRNPLMDYRQITECVQNAIEIGAHGCSHASLTEPNTDVRYEVEESKKTIEKLFPIKCQSFCYPYGHFNTLITKAVEEAGFGNAVSMIRSRVNRDDNPFLLPRIPINWRTTSVQFLVKLLTGYEDRRRK